MLFLKRINVFALIMFINFFIYEDCCFIPQPAAKTFSDVCMTRDIGRECLSKIYANCEFAYSNPADYYYAPYIAGGVVGLGAVVIGGKWVFKKLVTDPIGDCISSTTQSRLPILLESMSNNEVWNKNLEVFFRNFGESALKGFFSGGALGLLNSPERIDEYVKIVGFSGSEAVEYKRLQESVLEIASELEKIDCSGKPIKELIKSFAKKLSNCWHLKVSSFSGYYNEIKSKASHKDDFGFPKCDTTKTYKELFGFTAFKSSVEQYFLLKEINKLDNIIKNILGFFQKKEIDLKLNRDFIVARVFLKNIISDYIFDLKDGVLDDLSLSNLMKEIVIEMRSLAYRVFILNKITNNKEDDKVYAFGTTTKTKNWIVGQINGYYQLMAVDNAVKYCGRKCKLLPKTLEDDVLVKSPSLQLVVLTAALTGIIGVPIFLVKKIGNYLYNRNKELFFPPEGLRRQTSEEEKMFFKNYKFDKNDLQKFSNLILSFRKNNKFLTPLILTGSYQENWSLVHTFVNQNYLSVFSLDLCELSELKNMFIKVNEIISYIKRNKAILFIKGCPLKNAEELFVKIRHLIMESSDSYSGTFIFNIDNDHCRSILEKTMKQVVKKINFNITPK